MLVSFSKWSLTPVVCAIWASNHTDVVAPAEEPPLHLLAPAGDDERDGTEWLDDVKGMGDRLDSGHGAATAPESSSVAKGVAASTIAAAGPGVDGADVAASGAGGAVEADRSKWGWVTEPFCVFAAVPSILTAGVRRQLCRMRRSARVTPCRVWFAGDPGASSDAASGVPDGYEEGFLDAGEDAHLVNDNWTYGSAATFTYVEASIANFPSTCVRFDGKPVAWAVGHDDGSFGMVYVMESHRRRGLARSCIVRMIAALRERGHPRPHVFIVNGNGASETLFARLGFTPGPEVSWIVIFKPARPRLVLRRATEGSVDADALTRLINVSYRQDDRWWVDQQRTTTAMVIEQLRGGSLFTASLSDSDTVSVGADSNLIGCVHVSEVKDAELGGDAVSLAEFGSLTVHPKVKGLGVGLRLLLVAEDEARAAGADILECHVVTVKPWLRCMYERNGFVRVGRDRWPPFMDHELLLPNAFHVLAKALTPKGRAAMSKLDVEVPANRWPVAVERIALAQALTVGWSNSKHHHEHAPWRGEEVLPDPDARALPGYRLSKHATAYSTWATAIPVAGRVIDSVSAADARQLIARSRDVDGGVDCADADLEGVASRFAALMVDGKAYFARLDACSPKDAPQGVGPFTTGREVAIALASSPRCVSALQDALSEAGETCDDDSKVTSLVLVPWDSSITLENEFRVFISEKSVVAVSQYDWAHDHGWGTGDKEALLIKGTAAIVKRYDAERNRLPFSSCVMDVHLCMPDTEDGEVGVQVLEFDPFGPHMGSGSALFHWVRDFDQLHGNTQRVVVRVVSPDPVLPE